MKLKDGCDLSKEHYYLYFCGHNQASEGKDQCFNFKDPANGGRPDRYVPVKVAVFDEQATQQQDKLYRYGKEDGTIAANTAKPEPIYRWVYRPEMQFSVFGLTVNHINRVDDENQPQNIIDLTKQDTPSLTGGTDYVEVLYDILMNNDAPLTSFGPDRELVLALGEDEVKVIIGQDKKLKFNNIEHLALLDSKDLLTIRLYTNNDAANILWEFAFGINGLHVDYQIPHIETAINLEQLTPTRKLVRTLGGLRLKYRYQPPAGEKINSIVWTFNADGWFCSGPGVDGSGSCQHLTSGTPYTQNIDDDNDIPNGMAVWWEPSTNSGTQSRWEEDIDFLADYDATTEDLKTQVIQDRKAEFAVQSRPLIPDAADPMEGADVQMLEQLLWQLGLGPNESLRGNQSVRKATDRYTYDTGCSVSACSAPSQTSSMEWMTWRFKYANEINGTYSGNDNLTISNHVMNQASLNVLKDHWENYYEAFRGETATTVNGSHAQYQSWLTAGAAEWDAGNIYPDARHQAIMQKVNSAAVSRSDLLDGWVLQESSRSHWGVNNTDHRINIGTADSRGSVGFHQVQSRFILGALSGNACTHFSGRNLYAPSLGASAIVWWGVKAGCGTAFDQSMGGNFDGDYDNSGVIKLRRSDHDMNVLAAGTDYVIDDYERLSKSIAWV